MAGGATNPIMPGGYALAGEWARSPLGGLDLENQPGVMWSLSPSTSSSPFPEPPVLSPACLVPNPSSSSLLPFLFTKPRLWGTSSPGQRVASGQLPP